MPLLLADQFLRNAELFRTTLFSGRTGSGKTLLAAIVAKMFKDSGIVSKAYSNIPISFGDTPPETGDKFDFLADYAEDAVYILDEAWLGLMSFDKERIKSMFAFPRKKNQVFLLTSVLPLTSVSKYCFHHVMRLRSFEYFGIPAKLYSSRITGYKDKPEKFWLWLPHLHYNIYDTTATPVDLYPIAQGFTREMIARGETYGKEKIKAAKNKLTPKIGVSSNSTAGTSSGSSNDSVCIPDGWELQSQRTPSDRHRQSRRAVRRTASRKKDRKLFDGDTIKAADFADFADLN